MTGIEFTSRIRDIPVYPAAETYGYDGELTLLASNETPWGPHGDARDAVEAQLSHLNRYPDPSAAKLRRRAAPPARLDWAAGGRPAGGARRRGGTHQPPEPVPRPAPRKAAAPARGTL